MDNTKYRDSQPAYTESFIEVVSTTPNTSTVHLDNFLPSIALLLGVATGLISVVTTLNKGQEEKINRLMVKLDELDLRLDTTTTTLSSLSDKYATKQELISLEQRLEGHFNRLSDKFDNLSIFFTRSNL